MPDATCLSEMKNSPLDVKLCLLNQDPLHAGDYLVFKLSIVNKLDIPVGPIFGKLGMVGCLWNLSNQTWKKTPSSPPSNAKGKYEVVGGGTVFVPREPYRPREEQRHVLWCPPTIISTTVPLSSNEVQEYRWTIRLPRYLPPTYEGSKLAIRYEVQFELKVKGHADIFISHRLRLLPFFFASHGSSPNQESLPPIPFGWYSLEEGPLILREGQIHLWPIDESSSSATRFETVMNRFIDRGIIPQLVDFQAYPRDRTRMPALASSREKFKEFAQSGNTKPTSYLLSLPSGQSLVTAYLNCDFLRLGEQLQCRLSANPQGTIQVFQFVAQLISTETIEHHYDPTMDKDQARRTENVYRRYEDALWMHRETTFFLSIPQVAPTSIFTDLFTLKWSLRITLFCGGSDKIEKPNEGDPDNLNLSNPDKKNGEHMAKTLKLTPIDADAQRLVIQADMPLLIIPAT